MYIWINRVYEPSISLISYEKKVQSTCLEKKMFNSNNQTKNHLNLVTFFMVFYRTIIQPQFRIDIITPKFIGVRLEEKFLRASLQLKKALCPLPQDVYISKNTNPISRRCLLNFGFFFLFYNINNNKYCI